MATNPPTTAKPWWQSKTLWFNLVVAVAAAAEASVGLLQPLLPINIFEALSFLLVVGNAALRVISKTALALRSAPPDTAPVGFPLDAHAHADQEQQP